MKFPTQLWRSNYSQIKTDIVSDFRRSIDESKSVACRKLVVSIALGSGDILFLIDAPSDRPNRIRDLIASVTAIASDLRQFVALLLDTDTAAKKHFEEFIAACDTHLMELAQSQT